MVVFTGLIIGSMVFGRIFFGPPGFDWTFGSVQILLALIHFVVLLRTRNVIYLIPTGMYTLWWLTFFPPFAGFSWHSVFAVASVVFLCAFIYVLISKKINWRYKEILQLAAEPVTGRTDGFTSRPFPGGRAEFTRNDAEGLARFLKKHVIAFPVTMPDRVVLIIPEYMWVHLLFFKKSFEKSTYVAFWNSGEVTVRISECDYRKYRDELRFDQLCASLANLFKLFMAKHKEGNPGEIVSILNAAGRSRS